MAVQSREVIAEPQGRQRDALVRAALAKHESDLALMAAMAAHQAAADRLKDVIESITGEDSGALQVDAGAGMIYRTDTGGLRQAGASSDAALGSKVEECTEAI
jgi:hypothetical protein